MGLFGGGGSSGPDYGHAEDTYKEWINKAIGSTDAHEKTGRSDLEKYLEMSQGFTAPYRQAGGSALQAYLGSLGLGGPQGRAAALTAFHTSPAYQSALNEGLGAINRNMAASGQRGSGAEQKALTSYAVNQANKEYSQWQGALAGLTGMGERTNEAAAQRAYGTGGALAQLGLSYSGQFNDLYGGAAAALSSIEMEQARAKAQAEAENAGGWGGIIGGITKHLPNFGGGGFNPGINLNEGGW